MTMKPTVQNRNRTDRAWKKLYQRLEEDALLRQKPTTGTYRWKAAAILAVGLLSGLAMYFADNRETETTITPLSQVAIRNTESPSLRTTILEDSSIVHLDDKALLTFPTTFAQHAREVTLEGTAIFDVTGNPQRPFRIRIGKAEVEVLGTSFYVKSEGSRLLEAGVKSGRIKITHPESSQPVYIGKGEKAVWQGKKFEVSSDKTENTPMHHTRYLRFKDEPLGHVLYALNRMHPNDIQLSANPETGQRKLTFTYTYSRPEDIADIISKALGISYRTENNMLIFTE